MDALAEVNIVHPFPIQQMAIPIALTGTDMIGQARTGTGKTLAFGITALQRIVVPSDRDFELPGQARAHRRPWSSPRPASWRCRSARTSPSPPGTARPGC